MGDRDRRAETAERTATRARRARELRSLLVDQLAAVIGRGAQVGFLDFPFHTNPEDAMIFEGTMSAFAELSIDVVRLSDQAAYRRDDYASLPADTTMVFHGGGNFGDLFPGIHDQRLAEMVDLADFPLVVMPQTLTYATDAGLAETRRIVASLPRLTLLWRDASSLARATDLFPTARSLLVPDAAFGLAPSPRRRSRGPLRVEVLARNDASSSGLHLVDAGPWPVADWRYRRTGWGAAGVALAVDRAVLERTRHLPALAQARTTRWLLDQHARLLGTIALHGGLGRSDAVVVDRLHAWITAALTGVDVVATDTVEPKIAPLVSTWFPGDGSLAPTPEAAIAEARARWT